MDSVRKEPGQRGEICKRFTRERSGYVFHKTKFEIIRLVLLYCSLVLYHVYSNPDTKRRLAAWVMTMEV